jgi:hypothetical protein
LIYRRQNPSLYIPGFYCDGAYFYRTNSSGVVVEKKLSYTLKYNSVEYSIAPDKPSFVTEPGKLFFLSYTAGRPNFYPNN